jgi:hypothetical protein
MQLAKLPLLLHAIIEAAAASSFILNPDSQLPNASVEARLILRSYGGLLLSSSLLCILFYIRPGYDAATRIVTVAMGIYHVFPAGRAAVRIKHGAGLTGEQARVLGGPSLHFITHILCLAAFLVAGVFASTSTVES